MSRRSTTPNSGEGERPAKKLRLSEEPRDIIETLSSSKPPVAETLDEDDEVEEQALVEEPAEQRASDLYLDTVSAYAFLLHSTKLHEN